MATTLEKSPERTNRTGIEISPHADEMRECSRAATPTGKEADFRNFRGKLLVMGEAESSGSIPRLPTTADVEPILMDKLGERLAFERTGARLWDTMLSKFRSDEEFAGGPTEENLTAILREELEHFHMLSACVEDLGGDPTAVTPSANLAGVASMGLLQVVSDPRVSFHEALDAMLIAELADNDCWMNLHALAKQCGRDEIVDFATRAGEAERRHLVQVRNWLKARMTAMV
jgi:hypothetical protein